MFGQITVPDTFVSDLASIRILRDSCRWCAVTALTGGTLVDSYSWNRAALVGSATLIHPLRPFWIPIANPLIQYRASPMYYLITPRRSLGVAYGSKTLRKIPPVRGDIRITKMPNDKMGRTTISAWLFSSAPNAPDILPPLLDVRMAGVGSTGMNLTGVEQFGDALQHVG